MNCTDLAHFSISHDNPLNQEVRISKSGYRAFATLNGMDNVEEDVNYIRENVIPYFSYIKVTASAQFRQAVRAIGDISLRALYNYYPSNLFQQSRATIDTVTIASVVDPSTTFNLSGNTYIKIKQGSYATYPYICFLRVVIGNSAKGDIYATMKSVKIEFAKTNS